MSKTIECQRCQRFSGYLGTESLVCSIHLSGRSQSPCPDFAEVSGQWEPLGGAYYDGDLEPQPEHHLTTEERWELLNTYSLFTVVCPKCRAVIAAEDVVDWDCDRCGWNGDGVA